MKNLQRIIKQIALENNLSYEVLSCDLIIKLTKDNKILIPAAGMVKTEANIKENNKVKMTLGSKEVQGHFTQGAGFRLEGTAKFISLGEEYDMMKEKFPFLTRVLEITLTEIEQTL